VIAVVVMSRTPFTSLPLGEPIDLACDDLRHETVRHVATHERGVAPARIAVAAGARRDDRHRLSGLQEPLRSHGRLDALTVDEPARAALVPPREAPRRRESPRPVNERMALVFFGADLAADAEPAAPSPRTPGIRHQRVAFDHERILRLQRLDGKI